MNASTPFLYDAYPPIRLFSIPLLALLGFTVLTGFLVVLHRRGSA